MRTENLRKLKDIRHGAWFVFVDDVDNYDSPCPIYQMLKDEQFVQMFATGSPIQFDEGFDKLYVKELLI